MKKIIFLVLIINIAYSQDNTECFVEQNNLEITPKSSGYLPNGKAFTPTGELRALVIYVTLEESDYDPNLHDDLQTWAFDEDFPTYENVNGISNSVVNNDGSLVWAHSNSGDFNQNMNYNNIDELNNISEYFYHNSGGKFRFYAETLRHPDTDDPIAIKIDPDSITSPGYGGLTNAIKIAISDIYPDNYDWSRFDNRVNKTNYNQNNSSSLVNGAVDNIIDYTIIMLRNNNNWTQHPFTNSDDVNTVNYPKGVATLSSLSSSSIGSSNADYQFGSFNNGHLYLKYENSLSTRIQLNLHELAHNFMNMPHVNTTNQVIGDYFHFSNGITIMDSYKWFMPLVNAWESWVNGWIEIDHDINEMNYEAGTYYTLEDYIIDRSTIRVKLPYVCDQYVWFQNHKNNTPFYKRHFALIQDNDGNITPQPNNGLYAFIENIASTLNSSYSPSSDANGIKPLHGYGNFDYQINSIYQPNYAYNQPTLKLSKLESNPYSDQSLTSYIWEDGLNDWQEDGILKVSRSFNGSGSKNNIEAMPIWEVDDIPLWGTLGGDMNITQYKLSAFTNPPITNLRKNFDSAETEMEPTILHSLSITFKYRRDGNVDVMVNYEDGVIENDFRATGNMLIPTGEHIILANSKKLRIDKTETANTKIAANGSFNRPSKLISHNNSKLELKKNSKIILENESSLILKENSEIIFESQSSIHVNSGSLLCIDENTLITNYDDLPKIYVNGGYYEGPAYLVANQTSNPFFGLPNISNNVAVCGSVDGYLHMDNEVILPHSNCNSIVLNNNNFKVTSSSMINLVDEINIMSNSNFEAYITDINVGDCNQSVNFIGNLLCLNNTNNNNSYNIKKNKFKGYNTNKNLKIYPNPVNKNYLNIQSTNLPISYSIHIYDLLGKKQNIQYKLENKNIIKINLQNLNKGLYILKFISSKNNFTKKIYVNN